MRFKIKHFILVLLFVLSVLDLHSQALTNVQLYITNAWNNSSIVSTHYGLIKGYPDRDQTLVWKGIPYAQPPVRELRWMAPRPPQPWTGIKKANHFGNACTQFHPVLKGRIDGSEDCLYLNIWRPRTADSGLPVYVWIHGGGNTMGSAHMVQEYYGQSIAHRSQVVFVSINYRLGPFGWLYHPALHSTNSNALDISGNYGTLDIIQALKWIQENIEAFGGDPSNVTISGESAGGMNVLSLLLSDKSEGLFSKAICQSGAPRCSSLDESQKLTEKVIMKLLIKDRKAKDTEAARIYLNNMTAPQIRKYLYSHSDRQILQTLASRMMGMIDMPYILKDGTVIPKEGYDAWDKGKNLKKVPLIIGSNKDEIKLFMFFGKQYQKDKDLYNTIARYGSDMWKATGVDQIAEVLTRQNAGPVYSYWFTWGSIGPDGRSVFPGDWGWKLGAFHSLEIGFFLGNDMVFGGLGSSFIFKNFNKIGRLALSRDIMHYTSSFVHFGDPNQGNADLPTWLPWDKPESSGSLVLDADLDKPRISMMMRTFTSEKLIQEMTNTQPPHVIELIKRHLVMP